MAIAGTARTAGAWRGANCELSSTLGLSLALAHRAPHVAMAMISHLPIERFSQHVHTAEVPVSFNLILGPTRESDLDSVKSSTSPNG